MMRLRDQDGIPFQSGLKMPDRVICLAVISTLLINSIIFIATAISAFGQITLLNFIASFALMPIGLLALQYSRRSKIAQIEKNWKSEFLFSIALSCYISYYLYSNTWREYRIPSFTFIFLMTICFCWIDSLIKLIGVKRTSRLSAQSDKSNET